MKLRSYLRGIGIGILVTAALFIVADAGKPKTMTDAQVIARAKELGMIEGTVLSQMGEDENVPENVDVTQDENLTEVASSAVEEPETIDEPTSEVTEEVTPEATEEVTPEVTEEPTPEVTEEPTPEVTEEPLAPAKDSPSGDNENSIVIVVNSGDGSDTVARRVYEAGLVANASEFDKYLMANGYDRKITVGNHKIPASATEEEIAKNLVSSVK